MTSRRDEVGGIFGGPDEGEALHHTSLSYSEDGGSVLQDEGFHRALKVMKLYVYRAERDGGPGGGMESL